MRPAFAQVLDLWPRILPPEPDLHLLDALGLFQGNEEFLFQQDFDAIHYNLAGAQLIAGRLCGALAQSREGDGAAVGAT
jgi:hypothetical protein